MVGIAKGSVINTCTILVSDHSADRTRGMNLMHSCYACGALLCPFLIAAAARVLSLIHISQGTTPKAVLKSKSRFHFCLSLKAGNGGAPHGDTSPRGSRLSLIHI